MASPSKLNQSYTAAEDDSVSPRSDPIPQPKFTRELPPSPTKGARSPGHSSPIVGSRASGMGGAGTDAAAKLPPNVAREIREAFQVLDRDNDGLVNKDDVADVLMNLGRWIGFPFELKQVMVINLKSLQAKIPRRLHYRASSHRVLARPSTSRRS